MKKVDKTCETGEHLCPFTDSDTKTGNCDIDLKKVHYETDFCFDWEKRK